MSQFSIVTSQVGIFLILIAIGIMAIKLHIIPKEGLPVISKIIINIVLPAFIFINTVEGTTRSELAGSLIVLPLSVLLYALLSLISLVIERIFIAEQDRRRIFRALVMFGNIGFIGIPMVTALYPDTALIYVSLVTIVDQGLFWTLGVSLSKGGEKEKLSLKSTLRSIASPALIAIIAGILFVLAGIHLPYVLTQALTKLGGASMPMSLIYIGGSLAGADIIKGLKSREIYALILFKMILLPTIFYMAAVRCGIAADAAGTLSFLTGLPSINLVPMIAREHGPWGDYAVCGVMITTIACLFTLPAVSFLMTLL